MASPTQPSLNVPEESKVREKTPRGARPLTPIDPGRFAPISRDEALREGRATQPMSWISGWFGRRDVIPPTDDRRTSWIDRAMVGLGFITPDELAKLHTIGDDMLRRRPGVDRATLLAHEAVKADRQERAARKAAKKAEAAEREKQKREKIAKWRATEISYLGRGVSRGLANQQSNVEKLTKVGLPVLHTPRDVAQALGVTIPRLRWLAFHHPASKTTHYTTFQVPKKSGGVRTLASPKSGIRKCQSWIAAQVLAKTPVSDQAQGFAPGRSIVTNARPHVRAAILVNTDLSDFFPSITFWRVEGIFRELGYSSAVATILALLCTEAPRREIEYNGERLHVATGERALPQGACTSPALSNLAARRLDSRLHGIATKLGWIYTRYADDATFSTKQSQSSSNVGYLLARIRHICEDEGFEVNEKKTRILRRNTRQSVTGLNVNDEVRVPREVRRRVRAILQNAKKTGLEAQNRENHPNFRSWLKGMIAYIHMTHPQEGAKLSAICESLGN